MAAGLAYLHSLTPPVIHLDVKSLNVLLTDAWVGKLTDFGESRRMADSGYTHTASVDGAGWFGGEGAGVWRLWRVVCGDQHGDCILGDKHAVVVSLFVHRFVRCFLTTAPLSFPRGFFNHLVRFVTMSYQRGTLQWMAPEVFQTNTYTPAADVYSLAVVMWEIWAAQTPLA